MRPSDPTQNIRREDKEVELYLYVSVVMWEVYKHQVNLIELLILPVLTWWLPPGHHKLDQGIPRMEV